MNQPPPGHEFMLNDIDNPPPVKADGREGQAWERMFMSNGSEYVLRREADLAIAALESQVEEITREREDLRDNRDAILANAVDDATEAQRLIAEANEQVEALTRERDELRMLWNGARMNAPAERGEWAKAVGHYKERAESAEAQAAALRVAVAEAGIVLEALHLAGGTGITDEIARAVGIVRDALSGTASGEAAALRAKAASADEAYVLLNRIEQNRAHLHLVHDWLARYDALATDTACPYCITSTGGEVRNPDCPVHGFTDTAEEGKDG